MSLSDVAHKIHSVLHSGVFFNNFTHCSVPLRGTNYERLDGVRHGVQIIHHFVEILDRYFGNVCELDLIFNFHKVRSCCCEETSNEMK
jgi:hypothetical protein